MQSSIKLKKVKFLKGKYLSIKGLVRVIKTYVLSTLLYRTQVINLPKTQITNIEDAIINTIWNGKKAKIQKNLLKLPYNEGGLALVDINTNICVQRIKWLTKVQQMGDDRVKKFLASYHFGQYQNPIGPPIQGIELLKYRIPLKNISNIGFFYLPSLNL